MSAADLFTLFLHFLMLSLLAVGGAITVAPEMHRYLVTEQGWISGADFSTSIALAQAAPGPNILFVTLIGWNAGGLAGAAAATVGIMLPSSLLTLASFGVVERLREHPMVRAMRAGLAPVTIGLVLATAWILSDGFRSDPMMALVAIAACAATLRTRINPLWWIGAGALVGVLSA